MTVNNLSEDEVAAGLHRSDAPAEAGAVTARRTATGRPPGTGRSGAFRPAMVCLKRIDSAGCGWVAGAVTTDGVAVGATGGAVALLPVA
jgi:hypothetical protein